jgi:DNA modification methylase
MTDVKVEVKTLDDLQPDPNNVNKHTVRGHTLVENSLRKRGAFRSVAAAGKGVDKPVVMAGNLTIEKARDAGFEEVVFVHTSGKQIVAVIRDDIAPGSPEAIALGLEDNESASKSYSPDLDVVAALAAGDNAILSALKSEDKIFAGMLEGMGLKEETHDAAPEVDRAAELLEKWQVKTGDLWQIGGHRLICGDCTDKAVVERVMDGERADIAFTSPPYNVAENATLSPHQAGGSKYLADNDNKTDAEYLQFLTDYILHTLEYSEYSFVNIQSLANNKIVLIDLLSKLKDFYADTLIWDKMNAQPAMAKNVLNSQFEYVHAFSNKGTRSIGTKEFRGTISNVVQVHKKASEVKEHNATFSIEFASFFVDSFSTTSVFDGFSGSGTTLVACENLSRRCRAIEISPAYVAVALERMSVAFPALEIKKQ